MNSIRKNFLEENKNRLIRLIFANGFQLRGRLVDYDEVDMLIETQAYSSGPIVIPLSAVSTFVPVKNH